jgi:hypothetical protein
METIAVTSVQSAALLREAKKRAKKTKVQGGYATYFKHVRGAVPQWTDNKTSCAGHRLVRVVHGLRKCADIKHKSLGNVHFAPRTKLARKHPRGVACFMKWTTATTRPFAPRKGIMTHSKKGLLDVQFSVLDQAYKDARDRYIKTLGDLNELQSKNERIRRSHYAGVHVQTDVALESLDVALESLRREGKRREVEKKAAVAARNNHSNKQARHAAAGRTRLFGF